MNKDKLQARISEKEAQEHDEILRNKALAEITKIGE